MEISLKIQNIEKKAKAGTLTVDDMVLLLEIALNKEHPNKSNAVMSLALMNYPGRSFFRGPLNY